MAIDEMEENQDNQPRQSSVYSVAFLQSPQIKCNRQGNGGATRARDSQKSQLKNRRASREQLATPFTPRWSIETC